MRHYVKLNWAWCQGKMNKCADMYSTRQTWTGEMGGDSIGRCEIISQYQSGHSGEQTCVTRAPYSVANNL
jgi:hypothetical protein